MGVNDPEAYQEDKYERLQRLKKKRDELKLMLEAIDDTLIDLGYINERTSVANAKRERESKPLELAVKMAQSGIRIKDKLSCRGDDLTAEFFDYLDEDSDNYLNFKDFRSMQTKITPGYLHPPENMSIEAWRLYLMDLGVKIHPEGVDKDGFLRFRRNIESYQPLSKEIIAHDLNVLPTYLHKWKLAKILINELKFQRKQIELQEKAEIAARSGGAEKFADYQKQDDEVEINEIKEFTLSFDDVSFILGNLEIPYYKSEYAAMRQKRVPMEQVCLSLLTYYLKHNFATSPTRYGHLLSGGRIVKIMPGVEITDIERTPEKQVIAFIFQDRIPSSLIGLTKKFIIMKYKTIRCPLRPVENLQPVLRTI